MDSPDPAKRSLLIDSASLNTLTRDGPALCIAAGGKARQWFPLRRLALVHCIGLPASGMEALATVASEGIPVTFFTRRGQVIAQLIHPGALNHPLGHWLETLRTDLACRQVYDTWLENQLRHTYGLIGCLGRDSTSSATKARKQLDSLARKARGQPLLDAAEPWFAGLITARLQRQAVGLGISANSSCLATISDDLLPAATHLCLTWLALHLTCGNHVSEQQLPAYFESALAADVDNWLARALANLANQLERHLLSQDSPYPEHRR